MKQVRTTVVLPEEDVRKIKILKKDKNVKHSKKAGWWSVVGSLNLGGREPPRRQELYDRYLDEKLYR